MDEWISSLFATNRERVWWCVEGSLVVLSTRYIRPVETTYLSCVEKRAAGNATNHQLDTGAFQIFQHSNPKIQNNNKQQN